MTLIELLVSMIVLSIVATMVVVGWSSLQASYSSTVKGSEARSAARDAVSRMTREIRDMQPEASGGPTIATADDSEIVFYSAFNDADVTSDSGTDGLAQVALVSYRYMYDASTEPSQWCIYRQRDTNGDGLKTTDPEMVVARNIVNGVTLPGNTGPIPLFQYFENDSKTPMSTPVAADDIDKIATIKIHVVADLNPEHTPTYFDLVTTIRPRN